MPDRPGLHRLGRLKRFAGVDERIRRLVDSTLALEPDHVLLTGDLTALGDETELREVRALLEPLIAQRRLTLIPGNHDRYTDAPGQRTFERVFGDLLRSDLPGHADGQGYPFVKLLGKSHALIGLDSTRVPSLGNYFFGRLGPAQLAALAYAQGNDIHLGPGQEHLLPHEAWHVVQQRQCIVPPTLELNGVHINDDRGLEAEANRMGNRALQLPVDR